MTKIDVSYFDKMRKPPRPIRIDGDVAYITLTQGMYAIVDTVDAHEISRLNWIAMRRKHGVYAQCHVGSHEGKRTTLLMHRFILDAPDGCFVDHISGDGLDNRRENLRITDAFGNARNRRINANNTSGYKGVHFSNGKWVAKIKLNNKRKHLGSFSTVEEAAAAYAEASERLHGEFGRVR